jgi:hypothetical protein
MLQTLPEANFNLRFYNLPRVFMKIKLLIICDRLTAIFTG